MLGLTFLSIKIVLLDRNVAAQVSCSDVMLVILNKVYMAKCSTMYHICWHSDEQDVP